MVIEEMYLARAIRDHGSYAAAVQRMTERLNRLSEDGPMSIPFATIGEDMGVMIGHMNRMSECPACKFSPDLLPIELAFLEAFGRFERSANGRALTSMKIGVCFADASDFQTVEDPLKRYMDDLGRKWTTAALGRRVPKDEREHGVRSRTLQ
jgi:hypothetical protein